MNHSVCLLLVMHFSVTCSVLNNKAQVEYINQQHMCLVQLYFMSLLENVAKIFGASFQVNRFQVDKIYTTWSIFLKKDHC